MNNITDSETTSIIADTVYTANDGEDSLSEGEELESFTSAYKQYKAFCKARGSLNSSINIYEPDEDFLDMDVQAEKSVSFHGSEDAYQFCEEEMTKLLQQNKTLRVQNNELIEKTELLLRQVETVEDEKKQRRLDMVAHEKELKNCHEIIQDLRNDNQQLQAQLHVETENKGKLENDIKRLKADEEDLMQINNNMRNLIDSQSKDLQELSEAHEELSEDTSIFKNRCETLQGDIDVKNNLLEQKLRLYQEIHGQAEEYKALILELRQEKETVLDQFREMQLEYSGYQNFTKFSTEIAPSIAFSPPNCIYNLQSEIAEAEMNKESILRSGDGRSLQANSPKPEVKRGLRMRRSAPSTPINGSLLRVPLLDGKVSNSALFPDMKDRGTQTEEPITVHSHGQTKEDSINAEELGTLVRVQEHCSELKEKDFNTTLETLDHMKKKVQYLATQLGINRTKERKLISLNQDYVSEIARLTGMAQQLCRNEINTKFADKEDSSPKLTGENMLREQDLTDDEMLGEDTEYTSSIIDALALENAPFLNSKLLKSITTNSMNKRSSNFSGGLQIFRRYDKISIKAKLCVLRKCIDILQFSVSKKIEMICEMVREITYGRCTTLDSDVLLAPSAKVEDIISDQLWSLNTLMLRYGSCCQLIGVFEAEKRFCGAIELFVRQVGKPSGTLEKREENHTFPLNHTQAEAPTHESYFTKVELDSNIANISPVLLNLMLMPYKAPIWMKNLTKHELMPETLLHKVISCGHFIRSNLNVSRRTVLLVVFLLCAFFSVSPVDYQVKPVF